MVAALDVVMFRGAVQEKPIQHLPRLLDVDRSYRTRTESDRRPQGDSLSIHPMVSAAQSARRIVVNSLLVGQRTTVEGPSQSNPTA